MAELKTKKNEGSVDVYMANIADEKRRNDTSIVSEMMERITGQKPKMWGDSIVGFGEYHYKGKSGREGDWFKIGFSSRKKSLTLYFSCGFDYSEQLLLELGTFSTGASCLYVNKLSDIDLKVLEELILFSYKKISA